MVSMLRWSLGGGLGAFVVLYVLFGIALGGRGEMGICAVLAFGNAISIAGICAMFAAMKSLLVEIREMQRQLKHWQSIQSLDVGLDEPSTHLRRSRSEYD